MRYIQELILFRSLGNISVEDLNPLFSVEVETHVINSDRHQLTFRLIDVKFCTSITDTVGIIVCVYLPSSTCL